MDQQFWQSLLANARTNAVFWGASPADSGVQELCSVRVSFGKPLHSRSGTKGEAREKPRSRSVDGGRFCAQGTGRRAVKCFDPSQDHQRRKH